MITVVPGRVVVARSKTKSIVLPALAVEGTEKAIGIPLIPITDSRIV